MKDQVFSGTTVEEALERAAAGLGVARAGLRYVVLDSGTPGGRGVGATPARVAILLDAPGPTAASAPPHEHAPVGNQTPAATLRSLVRALAEAAGLDLSAEIVEDEQTLELQLLGPGQDFFMDEHAEVLPALEHLLRKILAQAGDRRRLQLSCQGYRARRDQAIQEIARSLVEAVAADGRARETDPLNSYERRLVHIAVAEAGLRSYSVGEGADRRVVVAPAEAPAPDREG